MDDQRGRRAPTPKALESLADVPDGYRILPDPLGGQPLIRIPAQPAEVRLLLSRSSESARAGEPSQDYLVLRHDPRHLAFAVADGVGSSFLGDVAAQILSAALTDWLVTASPPLEEPLTAFLYGLSAQVADQVAAWPLPPHLNPIMRDALDAQRSYGSEAMFAAGVVDFRQAEVRVAWLGDVRVRVVRRDGTIIDHTGQTSERWSSRSGPRGEIRGATWPIAELARVIVGTDGLLSELDATVSLPDAELAERLDALALRPRNDDIALVDVGLAPRALPGDPAMVVSAGRHARASTAGSVVRRLIRAVTPPTVPPVSAPPDPTPTSTSTSAPPAASPPSSARAAAPQPSAPQPSAPPAPAPPPGIPAPVIMRRRLERGQEIIWSPVEGAESYGVQIAREPSFASPIDYAVKGLSFTVPPLPDPVYARIRSIPTEGVPGPWGPKYDLSLSDPR